MFASLIVKLLGSFISRLAVIIDPFFWVFNEDNSIFSLSIIDFIFSSISSPAEESSKESIASLPKEKDSLII